MWLKIGNQLDQGKVTFKKKPQMAKAQIRKNMLKLWKNEQALFMNISHGHLQVTAVSTLS